ncbi:MAG: hypothetical protein Q8Q35_04445 [Nanoarchaeota archaeon]|nr:hypothetical protein [Nanoarchaeota archaeon]
MFIYDNVVLEKVGYEKHLLIGKPKEFLGKKDNPEEADLARANKVGNPEFIQGQLNKEARLDELGEDYKLKLTGRGSSLRGFGGGLAVVVKVLDDVMGLYLPHRDLGAPGDRLVWDVCAGRTMAKDESQHYLHRMIIEGMEELTFVYNGKFFVPNLIGLDNVSGLDELRNNDNLTERNAENIEKNYGLKLDGAIVVDMNYVEPRNGVFVHQEMEDGSEVVFPAGWGIEVKYSGLELFGYGAINLSREVIDNKGWLKVFDTEEFTPGKFVEREVHEIQPENGGLSVYHKGELVRSGSVETEVLHRDWQKALHESRVKNGLAKDRDNQVPIPTYSATIKADQLTRKEAWPFGKSNSHGFGELHSSLRDKIHFADGF